MQVIYHAENEIPARLGGCIIRHETVRFRLVPGANEIPDEEWSMLSQSEVVKEYLKSGFLELPGAPEKPPEPAPTTTTKKQ